MVSCYINQKTGSSLTYAPLLAPHTQSFINPCHFYLLNSSRMQSVLCCHNLLQALLLKSPNQFLQFWSCPCLNPESFFCVTFYFEITSDLQKSCKNKYNSQLSLPIVNILSHLFCHFLFICMRIICSERYRHDAALPPTYLNAFFLRTFSTEPQYNNQNQEMYLDTMQVSKLCIPYSYFPS